MRIKQISVTKLFGIFDHVIPLNLDERITIIHGINGVGKTSILRLINGIFNSKYSDIRKIPFHKFKIEFKDNSYLLIVKEIPENHEQSPSQDVIKGIFVNKDGKEETINFTLSEEDIDFLKSEFPLSIIENYIPDLKRIERTEWLYLPEREVLSLEDIVERFSHLLPVNIKPKKELNGLKKRGNSLNIRFIESQRLLSISEKFRSESIRNRSPQMELSVVKYSNDLVKNIKFKLAEYGNLSQSLDRTFPSRVIQEKKSIELSHYQLNDKLKELENERKNLINAGLLIQEDSNFQIADNTDKLDESTLKLLSVYVEDVEQKLDIFSDLAPKIELFQRIINQRFTHKTLVIDQDKGFILKTDQGEILSPTDLSSGEQHELVMLYELLFKVKSGSLILIDEPEISLHVGWQVKFLEDLQEIAKLANIDILLATHSPDIINGRWDLTVELKGLS